ncbi:AraC family transcriptional regulator [Amycolatopsis sp. GA6-003]|uniref:AraC family transcriptional regulator n=1 Tax=Amycolatopsis sp. GA6-003 TaxID=2652444 RepID=UPI0039175D3A
MDAFSDLIRGVRAHGSLFGCTALSAPWSLRFVDGAPLTLCTLLSGEGWIVPEDHPPELLRARETILVRGPFSFVDRLDTPAAPVECGEFCATPEHGGTQHHLGWNDPLHGETNLIVGAYPVRSRGRMSALLDALPVVVRPPSPAEEDPVLDHLAAELAVDAPGQQVVLDRLLDWMLVCLLRDWFDRPGGTPPPWWAAQRDPVVGAALRLLHADPAAPWTVVTLASRVGVSRSTLAKRFADLVGEPPMTYLTRWRMTLASDLLTDQPSMPIAEVARAVGYSDAFGFSSAFKRLRGVNPTGYRRSSLAGASSPG